MVPPQTPTSTTPNQDGTVVINGNEYIYELIMFNGDIAIRIPNRMIHNLTIIDSIYAVFHHGFLVVKNEANTLENFTTETDSFQGTSIRGSSMMSKGNVVGDLIIVKIKPKLPPFNNDSLANDDWSLSFMFSVYEEDEMYDPTSTDKLKIYRFLDVRSDILNNNYLPWSTADVLAKEKQSNFNISQLGNQARAVKTGLGIRDIIETTLVDFENKFDPDWDNGATSIFYSKPMNVARYESIEYLLDTHISIRDNDNCFLKFERNGVWSLLPVQKYFQNALKKDARLPGDFTIDIFHLHNQNHTEDVASKIPPKSKNAYDVRIPLEEFTGLFNYGFANIANRDSTKELVTTPVHTYMTSQKQFAIDFTDNTIDDIQQQFQDMYIKHMHGEPAMNNIPVNPAKQQNVLYNPIYSNYDTGIQRLKEGRNRVFQKALAFSHGLTFNLEGFTIRRSGRFISVVNSGQFPDTAFQNVIQGEWFITQVAHIFTGNTYRNDITCIKPYTFKPLT